MLGVAQKTQASIDENAFEGRRESRDSRSRRSAPMEDVEQERFKQIPD